MKPWDQFKINFSIAYTNLKDKKTTVRQTGYANNIELTVHQDTVTAIANLANATVVDREVASVLTTTVSRLTVDLAVFNAKLVKAITTNLVLAKQVANNQPHIPRTNASYTHYR